MATTGIEVDELRVVLRRQAERNSPVTLTVQVGTRWRPFRSRFLALRDDHMWVEYPSPPPPLPPPEILPDQPAGMNFALRRHRVVLTSRVLCREQFQLNDDLEVPSLRLLVPQYGVCVDRRCTYRVEIPKHQPLALRMWDGGQQRRPIKGDNRPIYQAFASDISSGGLLARKFQEDPSWNDGDFIGLDLLPRSGPKIATNALVRHRCDNADGAFSYGLQFINGEPMDLSPPNLLPLASLVASYERYWLRRRSR